MKLSPENERLKAALLGAIRADARATNPVWLAYAEGLAIECVAVRDALAKLGGETVSSYSLGGRSFTRRDLGQLGDRAAALTQELAGTLPAAEAILPRGGAGFAGVLFDGRA